MFILANTNIYAVGEVNWLALSMDEVDKNK